MGPAAWLVSTSQLIGLGHRRKQGKKNGWPHCNSTQLICQRPTCNQHTRSVETMVVVETVVVTVFCEVD